MSHEIDFSTGQAAYFGTEQAWHGLGTVVSAAQTSAEAIRLGGQDWTVTKRPLEAVMPDGDRKLVADAFAVVRDDTQNVLGVVGPQYTPFQNREAYDFMDAIVGEKLAVWESVGSLKEGRTVFMLAKLPSEIRVGRDDVVKPYTLLVNTHDGTAAFKAFDTSIRVVCQNTLTMAFSAKSKREGVSIRHVGDLQGRVKQARAKLQIVAQRFEVVREQVAAMAGKGLTYGQSLSYFRSLYPTEVRPGTAKPVVADGSGLLQMLFEQQEQRQQSASVVAELIEGHYAETQRQAKHNSEVLGMILANYDNSRNRLPGIEHTAWAAYNSVSEYIDHQAKYRGKDNDARAESRLNSTLLGAGNTQKLAAYDAALALCS